MNHLDPWEKHVSRQLLRHTATPPADGWDAIERKLRQLEADKKASAPTPPHPARRIRAAWTVAALSAAACLTLVLVLERQAADLPSIEQVAEHPATKQTPLPGNKDTKALAEQVPASSRQTATPTASPMPPAIPSKAQDAPLEAMASSTTAEAIAATPTDTTGRAIEETQQTAPAVRRATPRTGTETSSAFALGARRNESRKATRRKRAVQLTLHSNAAPTSGAENNYGHFPNVLIQGETGGSGLVKLSDVTHVMLLDFYSESEQEIDYKVPVQVGLGIGIPLSQRWSLHTGLSYTYLGTDIKKGNSRDYTLTRQKLHYVGIPVQISFEFLDTRPVTLYASAGGMIEKCVKGESSATYHRTDGYTSSGCTDDRIGRKLWQFSLNAAAGVQFNIVRSVGIYCEPGLTYYIPDGSDLPTIRDAHPWNFSLQTGIRFTLP